MIHHDIIRIFNEVSPIIDIKKRKCSRNCIFSYVEDFDIIMIYQTLSLSLSVLLCYMIKSLD